jgi:hypothetical protein
VGWRAPGARVADETGDQRPELTPSAGRWYGAAGMRKSSVISRLRMAMIIGGVVDSVMVIVFLVPALRIVAFGESPGFHTPLYEWGMRLLGSLGAGWTTLLFWASRQPLARRDILLFTVFPVMVGAYGATTYGFVTHAVAMRFFVLFSIITFAHCPYFVYLWSRARRLESE